MDQEPKQGKTGRFAPGISGNPRGRPRRDSADQPSATTALATAAARPATRRDGWINSESGHGTARDRRTLTRYGVDIVTDLEALQLWRSEFLAATIIEQGPREAFSRGWHLKCENKELAEQVSEQAKQLGATKAVVEAAMKENAHGGAAIFPVLSGALGDLSQPLDEGAIASVDALHVFEPQELLPAEYYGDIRFPKFRRPAVWRLIPLSSGRVGFVRPELIHESRLIILPGTRVSEQTQPGQREGWGDSALTRPRSVIADFGLAWGSAATLLHQHGKETLELDGFEDMMGHADGLEEFDRHISAMGMAWSTLRMNVIGAKSRISRATGTLAGVSDVLNEFKVLMAAASRRPVSVLMGQSQSGLRTGDDDTRTWYKTVEADRADRWHHVLERIIRLLLLATAGPTSGREPKTWSIDYPALWSPTEKEVAETRKIDMDRAVAAVTAQIISADDVAESFYGGDTYSGEIVVDWGRREAQAKIDDAQAEQLNQGGFDPETEAALGRSGTGGGTDGSPEDPESESRRDELDGDIEDESDLEWDLDDSDDPDEEIRVDAGGYNPNRDKNGRFASGTGGGKSKDAGLRAARAPKFDASPHRAVIAAHKATEAHHRSEALRVKADLASTKAQARALPASERGPLKQRFAELKQQHDAHRAAAIEARGKRIAASREMQAARKEHVEKHRAATTAQTVSATPAAKPHEPEKAVPKPVEPEKPASKPHEAPKPPVDHEAATRASTNKASDSADAADLSGRYANGYAQSGQHDAAAEHLSQAERHVAEAHGHARDAAASAAVSGSPDAIRSAERAQYIAESSRNGLEAIKADVNRARESDRINSQFGGSAMSVKEYSEVASKYANSVSKDEFHELRRYSMSADRIVNPALRSGHGKIDETNLSPNDIRIAHENVALVTQAISRASVPRDMLAFRVVQDTSSGTFKGLRPGQTLTDHGFASMTADKSLLDKFYKGEPHNRVDMHITVRQGAKAAPINSMSYYQGEREFLGQRGSVFRVTKVVAAVGDSPHEIHMELQ